MAITEIPPMKAAASEIAVLVVAAVSLKLRPPTSVELLRAGMDPDEEGDFGHGA